MFQRLRQMVTPLDLIGIQHFLKFLMDQVLRNQLALHLQLNSLRLFFL